MSVLMRLVCSLALAAVALQAKADQVFDWSAQSFGTYTWVNQGPFSNGSVSGTQYLKTVTRTSSSYVSPPANPLPAYLPHVQAQGSFVYDSFNQLVWRSPLSAVMWNDTGDSLFAEGETTFVNGNNYINQYHFTGGTGAYAGAFGTWKTTGTVLPNFQQTWFAEVHLVIPSPVPEPETYAMLLAGLGLMAGVARRRKTA